MTNKLTKNDSMCDSVQYFDTIVAAFEAFLKKNGAHRIYFKEWTTRQQYKKTFDVFPHWRIWAASVNYYNWILESFAWYDTEHGLDYWSKMSNMWITWCNQNLKK